MSSAASRHHSPIAGLLRTILATVLCMAAAVTIFSAYGGYIRPSYSLLGRTAPLAVMAFPALALLMVILTAALALLRSRLWLIPAVTVAACFPSVRNIMPMHLAAPSGESAAERKFTLLTYNVMAFDDYAEPDRTAPGNRAIDFILSRDADIVCLQEAMDIPRPGKYNVTDSQAAAVTRTYPYKLRWTDGALTILSKYPMERMPLTRPAAQSLNPYGGAVVNIDGVRLTLLDCHLESIGLTDTDKSAYENIAEGHVGKSALADMRHSAFAKLNQAFRYRAIQADSIVAATDTVGGPLIVCGDFNDVPLSYAVRAMREAGMQEVFASLATWPRITFHANRLYFRIDHILYRGPIRPVSLEMPTPGFSDHYPMEATFVITR